MERIMAAIDGSAPSLKAVALAADLAGRYGAELRLVTVCQELSAALIAEPETYVRQAQNASRITRYANSPDSAEQHLVG